MATESRKSAPLLSSKAENQFPISHRKFKPLPNIPKGPRGLLSPQIPHAESYHLETESAHDIDAERVKKIVSVQQFHTNSQAKILDTSSNPITKIYDKDLPNALSRLHVTSDSSKSPFKLSFEKHITVDRSRVPCKNEVFLPSPKLTRVNLPNEVSFQPSFLNNKPYKSKTTTAIQQIDSHENSSLNEPRELNVKNSYMLENPPKKASLFTPNEENLASIKSEVHTFQESASPKLSKPEIAGEREIPVSSAKVPNTLDISNQHKPTIMDIKPPLHLNTQISEPCGLSNANSETSPTSPLKTQYLWKDLVNTSKVKCSQSLDSKEIERQETIFELINTESDYLNCLMVLVEFFERPLMELGVLRNAKILEIFANLNEILAFHTDLFKRMTAVYKKQFPVIDKFAFVFVECLDQMRIYSKFVVNYKRSLSKVAELRQTEKRFSWFLEQRHQKSESRNLSLEDLLLEPFQRLCRYPLLFEKILSCTHPDSPDRSDMVQVLCRIRGIIHEINEAKERFEVREEMHLAKSRIKGFGFFDFLAPSRELIAEGGLTFLNVKEVNSPRAVKVYRQKSVPLRVFLFNDCILLTKHRNKKTGPQYKAIAPPSRVTHVQEVEDVSGKNPKTLLKITTVNRCIERFVLEAVDEKDRTRWKDKINQTIPLHTRRKSDSDFELLNNHEPPIDCPIPFKNFESVKINLHTSGDSFSMQTKDHFLLELQKHDEKFLQEYRAVLPFWVHLQTCNKSLNHSHTIYLMPKRSNSAERVWITPTSIPGRRALPSVPISTPLSGRKSLPVPPPQPKVPKKAIDQQ